MSETNDETQRTYQPTPKAPALIIGILLVTIGALLFKTRSGRAALFGLLLIGGGFAAIIYSTTVHEWCAPAGRLSFSQEFGAAFWHGPNAWDCYHLVLGHKR